VFNAPMGKELRSELLERPPIQQRSAQTESRRYSVSGGLGVRVRQKNEGEGAEGYA
jgi:hypothetical protein